MSWRRQMREMNEMSVREVQSNNPSSSSHTLFVCILYVWFHPRQEFLKSFETHASISLFPELEKSSFIWDNEVSINKTSTRNCHHWPEDTGISWMNKLTFLNRIKVICSFTFIDFVAGLWWDSSSRVQWVSKEQISWNWHRLAVFLSLSLLA